MTGRLPASPAERGGGAGAVGDHAPDAGLGGPAPRGRRPARARSLAPTRPAFERLGPGVGHGSGGAARRLDALERQPGIGPELRRRARRRRSARSRTWTPGPVAARARSSVTTRSPCPVPSTGVCTATNRSWSAIAASSQRAALYARSRGCEQPSGGPGRVLVIEQGGRGGVADYTAALVAALAAQRHGRRPRHGARPPLSGRARASPCIAAFRYLRDGSPVGRALRRAHLGRVGNGLLFLAAIPRLVALARGADVVHTEGWEDLRLGIVAVAACVPPARRSSRPSTTPSSARARWSARGARSRG